MVGSCEAVADGVVDPNESALLFVATYTDSTCSTLRGRQFYLKNVCFETSRQSTRTHTRTRADSRIHQRASDHEADHTCGAF